MTPLDAAGIARLRHDVRTPLAVILGFADVLALKADLSEEERRDYATRIIAAANEIRDLLDAADE